MLVLTRKKDERIKIGDDITIVVVRVEQGKVRLGIEAPNHVHIMRQELLDADLADETKGGSDAPQTDQAG